MGERKIESNHSIKQRLSHTHGFRTDSIVLLEASYRDGRCTSVQFALNGVGMGSDFDTFVLAPQYDLDREEEDMYHGF